MANGTKYGVDGVSLGAIDSVSLQKLVLLQMADDRLDGISASSSRLMVGEVMPRV